MTDGLDALLAQARDAEPSDRIRFRDPIAACGETAIDAMVDWLGDRRLAAFAIRVLERIGSQADDRAAVVAVLKAVDRDELPEHLAADVDRALAGLGVASAGRRGTKSAPRTARPSGTRGRAGYWVMRTSPWERSYIWAEALEGRLRQGWGVADEQDLRVIERTLRSGGSLTGLQLEARGALRMLASWDRSVHVGDIVVAPNIPEYGRLSVFRVVGSYEWSPGPARTWGDRFGHILPVELLAADIDRQSSLVSDALRSTLRAQARLYNINGYGGDVEHLLGNDVVSDRHGDEWTEADCDALFGPYPPDGLRPTDEEVEALGDELGRTPDAIRWQWSDGASYVGGLSASTTSQTLMMWLDADGADITDPVILVRINRLFRPEMSPAELYEATRKSWVVGPRREGAQFALTLYKGRVIEVYRIDRWEPAPEADRWQFHGQVADEPVRSRYIGRSARGYLVHGQQSPIIYVKC